MRIALSPNAERPGDSLPDPLNSFALERFGVPFLYPYQRLVVSNILEGKNQIVILPTGAGKSLCFTLPSQLLDGLTVVIFPLVSLMSDQQRRLAERDIASGVLKGGQSRAEREEVWRKCSEGRIRIVLTNPETAAQPATLERLRTARIDHLVIDEAHTVPEWGESFRPAYLEVGRIASELSVRVLTAFTATASPGILEKITSILFPESSPQLVRSVPDRPNIRYTVMPALSKDHELRVLAARVERPALIFCRSRSGTELTARMLRNSLHDDRIFFYHAGLARPEKKKIEKWFFDSTDGILCATCAYGMGVDKANIRTVIHRDLPPSVESYLQESGRAGRDRGPSLAVAVWSHEDIDHAAHMASPLDRTRYESMLDYVRNSTTCRRSYLLSLLDSEAEVCFGCDVCDGQVTREAPGRKEMLRFVRRHSGTFDRKEARQVIGGVQCFDTMRRWLWGTAGFGAMADWSQEEVDQSIGELVEEDAVRISRRGPWKQRVRVRLIRRSRRSARRKPSRC